MTYEEARRRLESTTEFRFHGDRVLVRDPRWLRSIEALRAAERAQEAWRSAPGVGALVERVA